MLSPYKDELREIAFVSAHCGLKEIDGNRIYSVAASVISPDTRKRDFSTLVRYAAFTERERHYSDLSAQMLQAAPTRKEAADRLGEFLNRQNFVLVFDNHHVVGEVQNFCGDIRVVDLSFAAEFFLPHLESYTPKRIHEYLFEKQRDKISFSSEEIVALSAELVRHICGHLLNDNFHPSASAIRHFLKESNTLFGEVFTHIAKHGGTYFGEIFESCSGEHTANWKQFLEKAGKIPRRKSGREQFEKISPEYIEDLFRTLAVSDKDYAFRPTQAEYARHIASALNDHAVLTVEAGTGTGKTQGYLIPVMEFLYRNKDARIMISTYTKSLQEQIFRREAAFTKEIFSQYRDIPVALLKGKSSYVCAEKLLLVYEEGLEGRRLIAWLYFVNLMFRFRDADADAAGEKIRFYLNAEVYSLLSQISAKEGCTAKHIRCPAQVVSAEACAARLVVTNHHKLTLLDRDPVLADLFRNYIIDEANHFENAVRNAMGQEVISYEIRGVIRSLNSAVTRLLRRADGQYEKDIHQALAAMKSVREIIGELRESLMAMTPGTASGQVHALRHDHPAFVANHIKETIAALREALKEIVRCLKWIRDSDTCRILKILSRSSQKIRRDINLLNESAESLGIICDSLVLPDKVTSYQCFSKNWTLAAHWVEVADLIREHIYEKSDCVIYTAATLCHKGSFESFRAITGLNLPMSDEQGNITKEFRFKAIPSPFSKDALEIIVPRSAVSGKFDNKEAWMKSVVRLIPELIRQNRGRTLVLFSSYSDLNLAVEKLNDALMSMKYPLLIQQQGCSTVNLCEEFRTVKESVLFGVDTFWYGVDFKGDTLTQVIITRIPYPSPSDPIQTARKQLMSQQDFWKRYYYDTEIKMRQGIGRLIRCDTDRGKVVILDARYRV